MNEKNNGTKKKSKPAPRAATTGRVKTEAVASAGAYHVNDVKLSALISNQKPKGAASSQKFATFEEAKSAAIDSLLQAIEEAERELLVLKRAGSYEAWAGAETT